MRRTPSEPPELPGFEYVRLLGAGGFSDVFLYEQKLPRRKVAVKVLLSEAVTPLSRKQFADEANVMASLAAHPNIVKIFHADVARDGRPYFVMEYCSGPSLAAQYKSGPMPIDEVLSIGVRLSSAIATAHQVGILHRDIKPANVLSNDYGAPALTDFGISSTSEDITITTTSSRPADAAGSGGTSFGMSVPWAPPEMFGDEPNPDVRSDVFSLSATIFTLLSGHTPFEIPGGSNSQLDLAGRIQRGAVTPVRRSDAPTSLTAVLLKGMEVRPERRYQLATDFARALQSVELELGYRATPIEIPHSRVAKGAALGTEDPADKTRIRAVQTIVAQPRDVRPEHKQVSVAPARSAAHVEAHRVADTPQPADVGLPPLAESTVIRVTAPTVPDARPVQTAPRRRRSPWIAAAIVLALAVTAVVVAIGVRTPEVYVPSETVVGTTPENDLPGGTLVPQVSFDEPELAADGTSVTFRWSNQNPVDGDSFVWRRTDRLGDDQSNPTPDNSVVISRGDAAEEVCLEVWIDRRGTIGELTEQCVP